jgi:5-methylcytosine-specific restriction endonuclease McrA
LSPIHSICPEPGCGKLTPGGRCLEHRRHGDPNRHAKQRRQGKDTSYWRRTLRPAVLERDGYRCVDCGTPDDLTVDLVNPALNGDHLAAQPEDCATRCRSCHGSKDAPRAKPRTNTRSQYS